MSEATTAPPIADFAARGLIDRDTGERIPISNLVELLKIAVTATGTEIQPGEFAIFGEGRNIVGSGQDAPAFDSGEFTPTVGFSTPGNMSIDYLYQGANYTLIGNRVIFDLFISFTPTFSNSSGIFQIEGLPFKSKASGATGHAVTVGYVNNITKLTSQLDCHARVEDGDSKITLRFMRSGNTAQAAAPSNFTSGVRVELAISGSYVI